MKRTFLCILIILTIGVISTLSIYQYKNLDKKETSQVNDVTESSTLAMVLVEGYGDEKTETELTEFPDASTHYLDFAKSYCANGGIVGWDTTNNKVKITASKADSCKLYFRAGTANTLNEAILANNSLSTVTPSFSTATVEGESGLYSAEDDLGTSYYFRGDVENNYVKLGKYSSIGPIVGYDSDSFFYKNGYDSLEECKDSSYHSENCVYLFEENDDMYWRIVRINGDGTIRLVYDGVAALENNVEHIASVDVSYYDYLGINEKSVSYTYKEGEQEKDSTIKSAVDSWYKNNLKNDYEQYLADNIFCNDREVDYYDYFDENSVRVDNATDASYYDIYFKSSSRLYNSPQLTCNRIKDRYSVNNDMGNGLLEYPVGLLSADEVWMASTISSSSVVHNYLYSNGSYHTLTPNFISAQAEENGVAFVLADVRADFAQTSDTFFEVRPVINIKADVLFTGDGSIDTPYTIAGFEE